MGIFGWQSKNKIFTFGDFSQLSCHIDPKFLFRPSGTQRPRPRRVAARDQPREAAVGQEEEGGDAPETRGQDDEDHESPVSAITIILY